MILRWLATLPSFIGNRSTVCAAAPRRPENEQEYHLAGIEYQMSGLPVPTQTICQMGRVGSSGDNAAMESFFSLLQKNVLNRRSWATREQLRIAMVTWIERTYHRRRRQRRLGRLTPIEFETIMNTSVALAA